MSINAYQKILGAIRQWFEVAGFPAGYLPVRVRIDEAEHYQPVRIREYRALQQRFK